MAPKRDDFLTVPGNKGKKHVQTGSHPGYSVLATKFNENTTLDSVASVFDCCSKHIRTEKLAFCLSGNL